MPELVEAYMHWQAVNTIDITVVLVVMPVVLGMNQLLMTGKQVPLPTGPRDPLADHTLTTSTVPVHDNVTMAVPVTPAPNSDTIPTLYETPMLTKTLLYDFNIDVFDSVL